MARKAYTTEQIIGILREVEARLAKRVGIASYANIVVNRWTHSCAVSMAHRPASQTARAKKKDAGPPRPAPFYGYCAPPRWGRPSPLGALRKRSRIAEGPKNSNAAQGSIYFWLARQCAQERASRCPLYPQERTFSEGAHMSALCQKRTSVIFSRLSPTSSREDLAARLRPGLRSASASSDAG
jgi:hypothetical protein